MKNYLNITYFFLVPFLMASSNLVAQETMKSRIIPKERLKHRLEILKNNHPSREDREELSYLHGILFFQENVSGPLPLAKSTEPIFPNAPTFSRDELVKNMSEIKADFTLPPTDFLEQENDPFFKEILGRLSPVYQNEGQKKIDELFGFNAQFDLGEDNHSGIFWHKPMGSFELYVNRRVVPDSLITNEWVVVDTLDIVVNAQSFLKLLSENELIAPLSSSDMAAFAGISFSRNYQVQHHAPTFQEGLKSSFEYLFFPFLFQTPQGVLKLPSPSTLSKTDSFIVSAGALAYVPIYYGLAAKAGALFDFNHAMKMEIEKSNFENQIRLHLSKSQALATHAKASLFLDLYNIIQITLFTSEVGVDIKKSEETILNFDVPEFQNLATTNDEKSHALIGLINGSSKSLDLLSPYIAYHNNYLSHDSSLDTEVLFWGQKNFKSKLQVETISEGETILVTREQAGTISYFEKWWSKLLGDTIRSILGTSLVGAQYYTFKKRTYFIEYNQKKVDEKFETNENLNVEIKENYSLALSEGALNRGHKKSFLKFIKNIKNFPETIFQQIEASELRAPMSIELQLKINNESMENLLNLPEEDYVFRSLTFCQNEKSQERWLNKNERDLMLSRLQIGRPNICTKKMILSRENLLFSLSLNDGVPKQKKIKEWVSLAARYAPHIGEISKFFDQEKGIQFAGRLQATPKVKGPSFINYFVQGDFHSRGALGDIINLSLSPLPSISP